MNNAARDPSKRTRSTPGPAVEFFSQLMVVWAVTRMGTSTSLMAGQYPRVPENNSSYTDSSGVVHLTRVVPVPTTISPQAQAMVALSYSDSPSNDSLIEERRKVDVWQAGAGAQALALYPVKLETSVIAGIPVRVVSPIVIPGKNHSRVLINLHGGAFRVDSGSLTESIPIANLTQTRVISVLYRLAPEHPFPAAVDDAVAVYRELLKSYSSKNIGLYGTSAGAILTAEAAVRIRILGLPAPGALGIFSGKGDFSRSGDTEHLYALHGLSGFLPMPSDPGDKDYVGTTDRNDPVLSPIYADLRGMPPALFVSSTRDLLLSGTASLHRAFLRAGVEAQLVVFEALHHTFWGDPTLPESKEAHQFMANFFIEKLDLDAPRSNR
jgi:monoterpene epsilon-lactone hydrolase